MVNGIDNNKNLVEVLARSQIYFNTTTTPAIANGNEAVYYFDIRSDEFTVDNTFVAGIVFQIVGQDRVYNAINHPSNPAQIRVSFTPKDGGGLSVGVRVQRTYKDAANISFKVKICMIRVF